MPARKPPLSLEQILAWADAHRTQAGPPPNHFTRFGTPSINEAGVMDAPRPLGPPVLVVDDCPYLADALALLLKGWGFRAAVAHDGPAALALAAADPPAAVLLDIGLPGMDGCDLAARLRERPGMGQALLVALTGYGREEDVSRCYAAGIDRHLLKPVGPGELRRVLDGRLVARPAPSA